MARKLIKPLFGRQPEESAEAFEGFTAYRDMGVGRSLAKISQALGKSTTILSQWSAAWGWVERCAAWEEHLDAEQRKAQIQARREMGRRHADDAKQLQNLAKTRYGHLLEQVKLDPSKIEELSLPEARGLFIEMAKLERLARGESTESIERKADEELRGELKGDVADEVARQLAPLLERATVGELREMLAGMDDDDRDDAASEASQPLAHEEAPGGTEPV